MLDASNLRFRESLGERPQTRRITASITLQSSVLVADPLHGSVDRDAAADILRHQIQEHLYGDLQEPLYRLQELCMQALHWPEAQKADALLTEIHQKLKL